MKLYIFFNVLEVLIFGLLTVMNLYGTPTVSDWAIYSGLGILYYLDIQDTWRRWQRGDR